MQTPICTDDYGTEVYWCRYDTGPVWANDCLIVGGVMPGVKARYIMAQNAKERHKQSQIAFYAMDANCNTCANLERVKHPKYTSGFLYGKCSAGDMSAHPYKDRISDGVMPFHPDDWMGMPCYQSRYS